MVTLSYKSCSSCNAETPSGDMFELEGDNICTTCIDEYASICEDCEGLAYTDDCRFVDSSGSIVCDSCFGDYNQCWNCEYIGTDSSVYSSQCCSEYVCETCESDWHLECCGVFVCGGYCYDNHIDNCENSNTMMTEFSHIIHEYMHKPEPIFHGTDNNKYYGIELETQTDNGTLRETENVMHSHINNGENENYLYLKEDSSVSGTEAVSHPCSRKIHQESFGWDKLFIALKTDGHYTDTSAGMHVHINTNYFPMYEKMIDEIQDKFITLLDKHQKNWERVSGGTNRQYASMFLDDEGSKELENCYNEKQVTEFLQSKKNNSQFINRSRAINFTARDQPTIEFRFLRSTLEFDTFKARLQAIDTMVEFVKKFDLEEIACSKWEDILELAIELNHEEFVYKYGQLELK